MLSSTKADSPEGVHIGEFLSRKDLLECHKYHARLTEEACKKYRTLNPDTCRGCPNSLQAKSRRFWTREKMLKALIDYGKDKHCCVTGQEFKETFGLNSRTIKREWGSWNALCAAAGMRSGRNGKPNGRQTLSGRTSDRRITVDLRDLSDLYEALNEEADRNGRDLQGQIISILKGWYE